MALALAIDIGTSSVRATLWSGHGRRIGDVVQCSTRLRSAHDGSAEFDADELLRIVESALDRCLAGAGSAACEIVAVGTSCFWHSLLGIDVDGNPVTTVTTWADTRARDAAAELRASTDERAYHRRTGAMLHASYPLARIAWLNGPSMSPRVAVDKWMSFADYVRLRFFGDCATGVSMASGTGLFNPNEGDWDDASLTLAGITRSELPPVLGSNSSGLVDAYAKRWPAIAVVPWFAAVGDGACATIGSGCVGPGRIALTLGTSGALRIVVDSDRLEIPDGLFAYRVDGRRWVVGGALSEGGGVITWLCSLLGLTFGEGLDAELDAMPADSHGLTVLPFANGERSPGWRDDAHFAVVGMSSGTRPVAIVRAALESVAFRFQLIAERLRDVAPEAAEVVGSGGAIHASPAWCRILADVLGARLAVPEYSEASSRGAALLALEATGDIRSLADVPALDARYVEPDVSRRDTYRSAGLRQQKLYDAIIS